MTRSDSREDVMKTAMFRWLAPAILVSVSSLSWAQTAPGKRADPLDSSAVVPPLLFQSTLAGYQRHADQPLGSWREANETVNRIGGWRAYAREARQPNEPAPNNAPQKPANAPADHGGHKMN